MIDEATNQHPYVFYSALRPMDARLGMPVLLGGIPTEQGFSLGESPRRRKKNAGRQVGDNTTALDETPL